MTGQGQEQRTSAAPSKLPQEVIDDTFRQGALKYKTRGLTSSIHTYDVRRAADLLKIGCDQLLTVEATLKSLSASPRLLIVKSIDLEEQPKPHDVEKEIELLRKCNAVSDDERAQSIVDLLSTATEEPDDFTSILRLYLPHYPLTLTDWLDDDASRVPPLSAETQLEVGHKVAQQLYTALSFLHSLGISHRDIKPSNVLLTTPDVRASDFTLKLCDFGTATDEERPLACSTSTHPYTPPELLFSPKKGYEGGKVDVWQAACVVAEIFGEREPVDGSSAVPRKRPLPTDEHGADDDEEDDPFADDSTAKTPAWQQLQNVLFSDDPSADAEWSKKNPLSLGATRAPWPTAPIAKQHRTLFPRSKPSMGGNDLALASAHFDFCGLPEPDRVDLWPEAVDYQPSLERMPFPRRPAPKQPDEIQRRCALLIGDGERVRALLDVLVGSLQLSQGKRWTAEQAVQRLAQ